MDDASRQQLQSQIEKNWNPRDNRAIIRVEPRDDGKLALTVISEAFEGLDSFQREELFWPVMRDLPNDILVQMTYSLLLTPDEAGGYFAEEAPGERTPI
jgi:hypothetical protein